MNYDILPKIGYTNGISLKDVRTWTTGNIFVIQKQKNNMWIEDPKEVVIDTIEMLRDRDPDGIGYKHIITCKCGIILTISNVLMCPKCMDYEIYKNWQIYFSIVCGKIKHKKQSVKKIESFVEKFELFEQRFKESNPEKCI